MSIPKEPRQLMINIMYLVLTALLALNVSAEVMNAFFTLDDGNKASIATVDEQLNQTVAGINSLLEDASKAKYKPIQPAIEAVRAKVAEFNSYVNAMRDNLIDISGNGNGVVDEEDYTESYGKKVPKGKKNKDITTRLLVDEGQGEELKAKIIDTREELIKIYGDLLDNHGEDFDRSPEEIQKLKQSIGVNMPFNIDDETWQAPGSDKKSWSDFKFRQMPVAAVLPLLSQMQSDLKSSEAGMINSMAELTGGKKIEFDAFFPVIQADRSYVIGGEKINAKISVGTYSTSLQPENVKIYVGGSQLTVGEDGTAEYSITGSGSGQKKVPLRVEVTNPLTGETTEGDGEFVYEVGARSVAVSADKMNVFYIGVDNPLTVSASGVSSNDVRVRGTGGGINISKRGGSAYNITVSNPGEAKITVTAAGKTLGTFPFRVKRIPNPEARLSNKNSGTMGSGEFRAQGGVGAFLDDFDFDATCQVAGFELVYVAKRQDAVPVQNRGPRYADAARRLINQAKPGDIYYFDNVRAKCPGDKVTRKINNMVFKIQ